MTIRYLHLWGSYLHSTRQKITIHLVADKSPCLQILKLDVLMFHRRLDNDTKQSRLGQFLLHIFIYKDEVSGYWGSHLSFLLLLVNQEIREALEISEYRNYNSCHMHLR